MDAKVATLGSLIDKLSDIRDKRRELAKQENVLKAEYNELEQIILARLVSEGTNKSSSSKSTVSISQNVVADVTNWEKFHAFIKKTGYFHLLQRRVADPAYREIVGLAAQDKKLKKLLDDAGVGSFTKLSLNLRNI